MYKSVSLYHVLDSTLYLYLTIQISVKVYHYIIGYYFSSRILSSEALNGRLIGTIHSLNGPCKGSPKNQHLVIYGSPVATFAPLWPLNSTALDELVWLTLMDRYGLETTDLNFTKPLEPSFAMLLSAMKTLPMCAKYMTSTIT
jgi:hypothetical protein